MTILFYILGYLAVAGFICMAYLKIRSYMAASPLHVRWELYPVPHEGSKTVYGGSFMEEKDWWTKPRHISHWGDIKALLGEFGRTGHCSPELPFGVVCHLHREMIHTPVDKFFCFFAFHSSVSFWINSSAIFWGISP